MRKKYFLPLLFIIFPILAAIVFNEHYIQEPIKAIRHGVLLQPPLNMKSFNMFITNDQNWQIAYVPAVCCNSICGKELLQLSQLQKTLEKKGKQVHLKLIAKQSCEVHDYSHIFMEAINLQQVKQFQTILTQPGEATFDMTDKIFIIDPQQNLFVYYLGANKPTDILNDLNRIMTVSPKG